MRSWRRRRIVVDMTLHDHLEQNSFAYCDELPPDVAEGLPLTSAREAREPHQAAITRMLVSCKRVVTRKP
jgi:hypothetical protein